MGKESKTKGPLGTLVKWLFVLLVIYVGAGVLLGFLSFEQNEDDRNKRPVFHNETLPRHRSDAEPVESASTSKPVGQIVFQALQGGSQKSLKKAWNLCVQDLITREPNALLPTELIVDVNEVEGVMILKDSNRSFERCVMGNGFTEFSLKASPSQKSLQGRYRLLIP